MKKIFLLIIVLLPSLLFSQYNKAYILSEGSYSANSSKLSLYDIMQNNFTLNIFSPGNPGLYPDGLIFYNHHLYMLEQGSYGGQGKIYKLDSNGTVLASRSFGTNPYSLAISNNKIYTTNGPSGKVKVLNLNTFEDIKEINSGVYPQEIISAGNRVFVCNESLYGGADDWTITVISSTNDSVVGKISLRKDPSSVALSNDGKLIAGCRGAGGKIYKIDPLTLQKIDSVTLPSGFDKDISVDLQSENLYYINYNNGVSRLNLLTRQVTDIINNTSPSSYFYGYNYDYTRGKHYVSDAKNFITAGSVYIYNSSGVRENTLNTGIAPRRIIFKTNSSVYASINRQIISGYKLYQNYPNPFNSSTVINYSLSVPDYVSMKVYDLSGREVAVLVDGKQDAGNKTVILNSSYIPSGVYFCRMTARNFNETIKITILK